MYALVIIDVCVCSFFAHRFFVLRNGMVGGKETVLFLQNIETFSAFSLTKQSNPSPEHSELCLMNRSKDLSISIYCALVLLKIVCRRILYNHATNVFTPSKQFIVEYGKTKLQIKSILLDCYCLFASRDMDIVLEQIC